MTLHRAGKQKACFAWGYHMAATPAKRPGGFSFACRGCFATCCPFCSVLLSLPSLKLWQALAESNGLSGLGKKKKNRKKTATHFTHIYQSKWKEEKKNRGGKRARERECSQWVASHMVLGLYAGLLKWNFWNDPRRWAEQSPHGEIGLTLKQFLQIIDELMLKRYGSDTCTHSWRWLSLKSLFSFKNSCIFAYVWLVCVFCDILKYKNGNLKQFGVHWFLRN